MAKDKGQKKKDREKKVAQKKQVEAQLRSAAAKEKDAGTAKTSNVPKPNALTKGLGNQAKGAQAGATKQFSHRRMGGGG